MPVETVDESDWDILQKVGQDIFEVFRKNRLTHAQGFAALGVTLATLLVNDSGEQFAAENMQGFTKMVLHLVEQFADELKETARAREPQTRQ